MKENVPSVPGFPDWAAKAVDVPYAEFSDPQSLNLYSYVRNVPTTRYDAEGHCAEAITCGLEIGAGVGTAVEPGGGTVVGAGVGVVVGVVVDVGLGVYAAYKYLNKGSSKNTPPSTSSQSGSHATSPTPTGQNSHDPNSNKSKSSSRQGSKNQRQVSNMKPKPGSKGGPGAGKDFGDSTKAQGLAENQSANGGQAQCVFCGDSVGEGTGNKINFDHAISKANDGNNSIDNLNVTCEYCNKSKGTGDAPKNPKYPE